MSAETLLCDPVLRHGWDGIFNITICDLKIDKIATKKRQKSDKKATKFLLSIHYKDPSHSLARNNTLIFQQIQ